MFSVGLRRQGARGRTAPPSPDLCLDMVGDDQKEPEGLGVQCRHESDAEIGEARTRDSEQLEQGLDRIQAVQQQAQLHGQVQQQLCRDKWMPPPAKMPARSASGSSAR